MAALFTCPFVKFVVGPTCFLIARSSDTIVGEDAVFCFVGLNIVNLGPRPLVLKSSLGISSCLNIQGQCLLIYQYEELLYSGILKHPAGFVALVIFE